MVPENVLFVNARKLESKIAPPLTVGIPRERNYFALAVNRRVRTFDIAAASAVRAARRTYAVLRENSIGLIGCESDGRCGGYFAGPPQDR